jgi:hypothetical protein
LRTFELSSPKKFQPFFAQEALELLHLGNSRLSPVENLQGFSTQEAAERMCLKRFKAASFKNL